MKRIVTLTLNPAVDVACDADSVMPGHKIRTRNETHDPGGGGVNVARVITELGGDALALVMVGGVTGAHLLELLAQQGVPARGTGVSGATRICTTVHDLSCGQEYRFVPEGPDVTPSELESCLAMLAEEHADWLVLSGSLPRGVPTGVYARIAQAASAWGAQVVLDTSGPALKAALGSGLALIKPSLRELEGLAGYPLPNLAAQEAAAKALVTQGAAARIAVSLGAEGALLVTKEFSLRAPAIPVVARGAVGAGDSFCAAMVWALAEGADDAAALRWGLAAGAASVMNTGTAHPRQDVIRGLFAGM